MKHLKKFESFVEQITDDRINDFLNYKWNPNDPQIYRSHDVPDNIEVGDILIHRVDKSKDRFLKGTMSELVDILPSCTLNDI
jgi:hypothetical protein